MLQTVAVAALFTVGGGFCLLNFYLVVMREPLLKWLGRYDRHVSILPVIGQLFSGLGIMIGWNIAWVLWVGVALLLLDLGGIHAFAAMLALQRFHQH